MNLVSNFDISNASLTITTFCSTRAYAPPFTGETTFFLSSFLLLSFNPNVCISLYQPCNYLAYAKLYYYLKLHSISQSYHRLALELLRVCMYCLVLALHSIMQNCLIVKVLPRICPKLKSAPQYLLSIAQQGCWNLPTSRGQDPKWGGKRQKFEANSPIFKLLW